MPCLINEGLGSLECFFAGRSLGYSFLTGVHCDHSFQERDVSSAKKSHWLEVICSCRRGLPSSPSARRARSLWCHTQAWSEGGGIRSLFFPVGTGVHVAPLPRAAGLVPHSFVVIPGIFACWLWGPRSPPSLRMACVPINPLKLCLLSPTGRGGTTLPHSNWDIARLSSLQRSVWEP